MDPTLQEHYQQIMQVSEPEDLFDSDDVVVPVKLLYALLDQRYLPLKEAVNPAQYQMPDDVEAAEEASVKLTQLYQEARRRMQLQIYGMIGRQRLKPSHAMKSFQIGEHRYWIGNKIDSGNNATWYEGYLQRGGVIVGEVLIKRARSAGENQILQRELRTLSLLHDVEVNLWRHLPWVLDRIEVGSGREVRIGIIFRKFSGYTLQQVRLHPTHRMGVDPKHMVWMIDRLLPCLAFAHSQGIVRGSLAPEDVIIQPRTHNALMCGWGGAAYKPAITGERIEQASEVYSAPEVKERGEIGPWSDVYALGKLMIFVLGGDPVRNTLPQGAVPAPLKDFLLRMVEEARQRRPSNAWELYEEQRALKAALWGPRKFLHFDMA